MTDASNAGAPTPPAYNAPQYNAPVPAPAAQPGRTMGIVALILAFLAAPVGAILGVVALLQSKKAGQKNTMALVAIILGVVFTIIWIISMILIFTAGAAALNDLCAGLPAGEYPTTTGTTITCP